MEWWQIVICSVGGIVLLVIMSVMVYSIFDLGPSPLPPSEQWGKAEKEEREDDKENQAKVV